MPTLTIAVRQPFPRRAGMGAAPSGAMYQGPVGAVGWPNPLQMTPYGNPSSPQPVWQPQSSTSGASSTTSTGSSGTSTFPGRRGRPANFQGFQNGQNGQGNQWQNGQGSQWQQNGQSNQWQQSYTQQSGAPTQADLTAFQQALANAAALGVISPTQASQIQAQANNATDAQIQNLTQQINVLVESTPSAAAAASTTASATTAATSTSWWDGSTTIFGATVSNPVLVLGAGIIGVLGYAFLRKK